MEFIEDTTKVFAMHGAITSAAAAYLRTTDTHIPRDHANASVGLSTAVAKIVNPGGYLASYFAKSLLAMFYAYKLRIQQRAEKEADATTLGSVYTSIAESLTNVNPALDFKEVKAFMEKLVAELKNYGYSPYYHVEKTDHVEKPDNAPR